MPPGGTSDQGSAKQSSDMASRSVQVQCPHAGCACRSSRPGGRHHDVLPYHHGRRKGRCLLRVVSANDTRSGLRLLPSLSRGRLRHAHPGPICAPWRLKSAGGTPIHVTDSSGRDGTRRARSAAQYPGEARWSADRRCGRRLVTRVIGGVRCPDSCGKQCDVHVGVVRSFTWACDQVLWSALAPLVEVSQARVCHLRLDNAAM